MSNEKDWIDILTALMTPVIAIFGTIIAFRQGRINHLKFRHDLYDRRFAVYTALLDLISTILQKGEFDEVAYITWRKSSIQGYFLFYADMNNYFKSITERIIAFRIIRSKMDRQDVKKDDNKWAQICEDDTKHLEWFDAQYDVSKQKFAKFIKLDA